MSIATKALVQRFFTEICNQGELRVADEIIACDYINHQPAPGQAPGREGLTAYVAYLRRTFADLHFEIQDQVSEAEKVVTRFNVRGVQQSEFAGIPPAGKSAMVTGICIHRVIGGQLQECWLDWDALGLVQQLGTSDWKYRTLHSD